MDTTDLRQTGNNAMRGRVMAAAGVLAHFEAKPNTEQEMADFLRVT
ncbi:MAG TPA: hypothetical protein VHZ98_13160 [Galbitalea sp.]|jgi:hypothetical protein|nr:hypothetical protein [Galbitalea sp.]